MLADPGPVSKRDLWRRLQLAREHKIYELIDGNPPWKSSAI